MAVVAYEADLVYGEPGEQVLIPWQGDESVKLDRFNVLHLVEALPVMDEEASAWSEVSDEGAFDLSGDELHAHEQKRRREQLASLRSARMASKAIQEQPVPALPKTPTDPQEKPSPAILRLMQHTAKALLAVPEPAALEMKIMANHATDERFAFLRGGRYKDAWDEIYRPTRVSAPPPPVIMGLGLGYASSDSESGTPPPPPPVHELNTEAQQQVQKTRRGRAGEWAAKRKRQDE